MCTVVVPKLMLNHLDNNQTVEWFEIVKPFQVPRVLSTGAAVGAVMSGGIRKYLHLPQMAQHVTTFRRQIGAVMAQPQTKKILSNIGQVPEVK